MTEEELDDLGGQVTALRALVGLLVRERRSIEPDPVGWTKQALKHLLTASADTEREIGLAPQQMRRLDAFNATVKHALLTPSAWGGTGPG